MPILKRKLRDLLPLQRPTDFQESEELNRLQQYTVFLLLGIPAFLAYGAYAVAQDQWLVALTLAICALGLLIGWYQLAQARYSMLVYRLNAALFGILLIYTTVLGGPDGSRILWSFTFPLITVFLLGRREGIAWSLGLFLLQVMYFLQLLPVDPGYRFSGEYQIRYLTVYVVVCAIAYWFEYFRHHYRIGIELERKRLLAEQWRLQQEISERRRIESEKEELIVQLRDALSQVKTLSGLIPICSSCKKIRDDHGYWNQLEDYLQRHSQARLSHGICPDCAHRLYPDFSLDDDPKT